MNHHKTVFVNAMMEIVCKHPHIFPNEKDAYDTYLQFARWAAHAKMAEDWAGSYTSVLPNRVLYAEFEQTFRMMLIAMDHYSKWIMSVQDRNSLTGEWLTDYHKVVAALRPIMDDVLRK